MSTLGRLRMLFLSVQHLSAIQEPESFCTVGPSLPSPGPVHSQPRDGAAHIRGRASLVRLITLRKYSNGRSQGCISIQLKLTTMFTHQSPVSHLRSSCS